MVEAQFTCRVQTPAQNGSTLVHLVCDAECPKYKDNVLGGVLSIYFKQGDIQKDKKYKVVIEEIVE